MGLVSYSIKGGDTLEQEFIYLHKTSEHKY